METKQLLKEVVTEYQVNGEKRTLVYWKNIYADEIRKKYNLVYWKNVYAQDWQNWLLYKFYYKNPKYYKKTMYGKIIDFFARPLRYLLDLVFGEPNFSWQTDRLRGIHYLIFNKPIGMTWTSTPTMIVASRIRKYGNIYNFFESKEINSYYFK